MARVEEGAELIVNSPEIDGKREEVSILVGESQGFWDIRAVYREVNDWRSERLIEGLAAFDPKTSKLWWIVYPDDEESDDGAVT